MLPSYLTKTYSDLANYRYSALFEREHLNSRTDLESYSRHPGYIPWRTGYRSADIAVAVHTRLAVDILVRIAQGDSMSVSEVGNLRALKAGSMLVSEADRAVGNMMVGSKTAEQPYLHHCHLFHFHRV